MTYMYLISAPLPSHNDYKIRLSITSQLQYKMSQFRLLGRLNSCVFRRSYSIGSDKLTQINTYCEDQVKQFDKDHYLIGLLLPKKLRHPYFCLYAFNAEIATIADNTRGNATAAQIRFQFWENNLDQIFQNQTKVIHYDHPVLEGIAHYNQQFKFNGDWFIRSLMAR